MLTFQKLTFGNVIRRCNVKEKGKERDLFMKEAALRPRKHPAAAPEPLTGCFSAGVELLTGCCSTAVNQPLASASA